MDIKVTETVYFKGVPYRRYPKSLNWSDRNYFRHSASPGGKTGFLHRDVWEAHHGKIPEGYQIHHKHGYDDNSIASLELVTSAEHSKRHTHGSSPQQMAKIRELATVWHRSPEGREWHVRHGQRTWEKKQPVERACIMCRRTYLTYFPTRSKYCHLNCRQAAVRQRRKAVE